MERIPPHVLLGAYTEGVFPMADDGEIYWFSPLMRGIIPLDKRFHIPHGLKRTLKKEPYEIKINTAFREVLLGCCEREETWIDDVIFDSYYHLYELGYCHSFECWDDEGLQGGALRGSYRQCLFWRKYVFTQTRCQQSGPGAFGGLVEGEQLYLT